MKPNRASATAYLIAESTVITASTASLAQFVPAAAAELSARFLNFDSGAARLRHKWRNSAPGQWLVRALERLTIPGIKLHYALRKRFLEETARAALAEGFRQVVVFGAGFDTLALRLAREFPQVRFIEIDHPATQRAKLAALASAVGEIENLRFVPLELNCGLEPEKPTIGGYDSSTRTFFIAEGLLMYFTADEVANLFEFIRTESGGGSRLAFTYMQKRADGRLAFRGSSALVNLWLRLYGEPFKWGLDQAQLSPFLVDRGFRFRELTTAKTLRGRYLTDDRLAQLPLAEGENICVADCA